MTPRPAHAIDMRPARVAGPQLFAANDPQAREERDHHFDEYESGLDDVPTARMERAYPERWADR